MLQASNGVAVYRCTSGKRLDWPTDKVPGLVTSTPRNSSTARPRAWTLNCYQGQPWTCTLGRVRLAKTSGACWFPGRTNPLGQRVIVIRSENLTPIKVPTSSEVKRSAEGGASPPSNQLLPSLFGAVLTTTLNLVTVDTQRSSPESGYVVTLQCW